MTPPTHSTAKEAKALRRKRDYATTYSTRKREGTPEPKSPKGAGWVPATSTRTDWIDCKQDAAEVAAILDKPVPAEKTDPCAVCGALVADYEPEYCCSGARNECGCMGQPLQPCLCSAECAAALFGPKGGAK